MSKPQHQEVAKRLERNYGKDLHTVTHQLVTLCFAALDNGVEADQVAPMALLYDSLAAGCAKQRQELNSRIAESNK
jgi:hypothetical protein